MNFWLVLLGIIAFVILFPFIRCLFKRLICVAKIKRMCQRKSLVAHPTHPLWLLGSKNAKKCDLYIETPTQVFAIKLFGAPRRLSILTFKEDCHYFFRSYIALISYGAGFHIPLDSREKKIPSFDFRYKYKNTWDEKTVRKILLVNPTPMEFHYQPRHGQERIVCAGDTINGMEIASLQCFLKELEGV